MSSSVPAPKPAQPKRQVSQPVARQRSASLSKGGSSSPSARPSPPPRISETQPSPPAPLSPQPRSAIHSAVHSVINSAAHSPIASPAPQGSSPQDQSSAGASPRTSMDTRSPPPREPTPRRSLDARSPPPLPLDKSPRRSLEARSPPTLERRYMVSPPPPPSSPTTPFSPSAAFVRRSHRASLTSNASPPARDFAASLVRPSSVASSVGSAARAGSALPIPISAAKGAPAAPVATSVEGSPSPSSFGDHGLGVVGAPVPASRRLSTKGSAASLRSGAATASPKSATGFKGKAEDPFRPSPLGNSDAPTPTSAGGFLSGLSLSRKRNSSSSGGATALDILNKYKKDQPGA